MKVKYIPGVEERRARTTADIADKVGKVLAEAITGFSNYKLD